MSREVHLRFRESAGVKLPRTTRRNIYVKSVRAGQRVLASVTRFLTCRLKLAVNAAKSAVDRPWRLTFLGLACTGHWPNRGRVSEKALQACT